MARLPNPGGDDGVWGSILNDFLAQAHNTDGTLKDTGVVAQKYVKPGSGIPESDLASAVQAKLNASSADATSSTKGVVQLAGDLSGTASSVTIAAGAITASKIANTTITDAQISASAAIAQSKIANLTTDLAAKTDTATLTTKGDVYVATAAGAVTRLGVGGDNQVLTADSSQAAGVRWANVPNGSTDTATQSGTSQTVGTSSVEVVADNPSRYEVYIYNDHATNVVYLSLGGTASVGSGIRINPGGDFFYSTSYTGAISAISTGASTSLTIAEV